MTDLHVGILSIFAEAQRWATDTVQAWGTWSMDVESARAAYRARHRESGQCRSCAAPAVDGRVSCLRHLEMSAARSRRARRR